MCKMTFAAAGNAVAPTAADMHVLEEGSEQLDCYVPRTELVLRCALSREDDKQRILIDECTSNMRLLKMGLNAYWVYASTLPANLNIRPSFLVPVKRTSLH